MASKIRSLTRLGVPLAAAGALALVGPAASSAAPVAPVEAGPEAVRAPEPQLEPAGVSESFGTRFRRFEQEVGGVPVLGAEAVVADAPGHEGDLLVDDTRADIEPPPDATVSREAAIDRARAATNLRELRGEIDARLMVLPDHQSGRLVWRVLVPAAQPLGSFEVLVDARLREVVRKRDLLVHEQGSAKLFLPNAVVADGDWSADLEDNEDEPLPRELRTRVDLPRIRSDAGNCLSGAWVRATIPPNPSTGSNACAADRNFEAFDRNDDRFEAAMAYFHADRTQNYIQVLGFKPSNRNAINARQTPAHVNAIAGDNSFYDPVLRDMTFGTGGVDDAEDGDVIVHEYGHALQDNQVDGFGTGTEASAMGEGFGDYLAATMATHLATRAPQFNSCMFEWDTWGSANRARCLRRVDKSISASQAKQVCGSNPHCLGEAWSGALWQLRGLLGQDGIGRPVMDLVTLQSHFYLTRSASFDDGARALIAADRGAYGGAHEGALRYVLSQRKLLRPTSFRRELSFKYSSSARAFKGTLSAGEPRCVAGQRVKVFRKRDGPDAEVKSTTTARDGSYRAGYRKRDGTYYAKAPSSSVTPDTCESARSRTREID